MNTNETGRKYVQAENVNSAVQEIINIGGIPSRAKVIGVLQQPEFGGIGGDPENVGNMIDTCLVEMVLGACRT